MATPVIMPRQGQSVESCIIGKWYKKVGDKVSVGEDLFTYETDKAAFDEAAKVDGEVLAIFFEENDDVPCLTNVCVIGKKGEDFSAFDPRGASAAPAEAARAAAAPVDAPAAVAPVAAAVAAPAAPRRRGSLPVRWSLYLTGSDPRLHGTSGGELLVGVTEGPWRRASMLARIDQDQGRASFLRIRLD